MPDALTTATIAQLLIDARRTSYTLRPGGEKRVTLTLECVEMLCHEVLRLRGERRQAEEDAVKSRADRARLYHCPKCWSSFCVSFDQRSGYYLCHAYSGSIDATGKTKTRPCTYSSKEPPHA